MAHRTLVSLEDAFKAIKEIQERVKYYDTDIWDFHQRRITNAHPSIDDYDYVVRKELRDLNKKTEVNIDTSGSGGVSIQDRYLRTFGYGVGRNLIPGVDLLPPLIIPFAVTRIEKIYFKAKIAPTGSNAIADINLLGTSILNASKIIVVAGDTSVGTITDFAINTFTENDVLTFDMDQIGSTLPGSTLVVTMRFKVLSI